MARVVLSFERNSQLSVTSEAIMTGFWLLMVMPVMAADAKLPAQGARGHALFFDETAARHCGSCHALVHKGTALGPDLTRPNHLNARAIVTAIRATRSRMC